MKILNFARHVIVQSDSIQNIFNVFFCTDHKRTKVPLLNPVCSVKHCYTVTLCLNESQLNAEEHFSYKFLKKESKEREKVQEIQNE